MPVHQRSDQRRASVPFTRYPKSVSMIAQRNARLAGGTFLLYIAVGITQMIVGRGVSTGSDITTRLATMADHALQVRTNVLLGFATCLAAWVLSVTLYALTRDEDADIARFGLVCRVGEGVIGALPMLASLALLWLATSASAPSDRPAVNAVAATLFHVRSLLSLVSALCFAAGSLAFSVLLLRARSIPVRLAWIGVGSSIVLVVLLPLQIVGVLHGPVTQLMWLPAAAFEIPVGIVLLTRGIVTPGAQRPVDARAAHSASL